MHDAFGRFNYPHYFTADKLKGLRWGESFKLGGKEIKADDIVNLLAYLKSRRVNFFIFPDFTFFYGLVNVPSPQPILWFHQSLTYPSKYNSKLDSWLVDDLKMNKVEIVVLERASRGGTHQRLKDFPQLQAYVEDNFNKVKQIGIFNIYEQNGTQIKADLQDF